MEDKITLKSLFVQEIKRIFSVSELKFIIYNFMISNWHHPGRFQGGAPDPYPSFA